MAQNDENKQSDSRLTLPDYKIERPISPQESKKTKKLQLKSLRKKWHQNIEVLLGRAKGRETTKKNSDRAEFLLNHAETYLKKASSIQAYPENLYTKISLICASINALNQSIVANRYLPNSYKLRSEAFFSLARMVKTQSLTILWSRPLVDEPNYQSNMSSLSHKCHRQATFDGNIHIQLQKRSAEFAEMKRTYRLFDPGDNVRHPRMGIGVIVKKEAGWLTIDFTRIKGHRIGYQLASRALVKVENGAQSERADDEPILLDWEVLPPGWWRDATVVAKTQDGTSSANITREFLERLRFLDSHKPRQTYKSRFNEEGEQYYVFVFSNHVIAECPQYGNAAYILLGIQNWRKAFMLSRRNLLNQYRNRVKRVVHTGDWKKRLSQYTR